jgi:hypothetical protein
MAKTWVPKVIPPKPDNDQARLKGCPAWPLTGIGAGAPWSWCIKSRGTMKKCESCDWRENAET